MITKEGTSNEEIDNKIIQGRKAIGKQNAVLWNDKITMKTKQMIFSTIVEYNHIWLRNMGSKQKE